jgi:crotonobetainyl-CoA:carnitine CoA-transferase CaiB-like acyl-CoA transferase
VLGRIGDRARHAVPHGVFRCADAADGRERWIAIAIHDDADWRKLVVAMGDPAWATDASLAAVAGRLARIGEVECHVDGWTRTQEARPLAERLQQAGIDLRRSSTWATSTTIAARASAPLPGRSSRHRPASGEMSHHRVLRRPPTSAPRRRSSASATHVLRGCSGCRRTIRGARTEGRVDRSARAFRQPAFPSR